MIVVQKLSWYFDKHARKYLWLFFKQWVTTVGDTSERLEYLSAISFAEHNLETTHTKIHKSRIV